MTDFRGLVGLIKQRVDIVEFLEQHGMDVKRSGTRYWALCPFHDEDTPSFSIDQNTGRYYCFGCRETGDIFTYLQKTEGLTFKEALEEECDALHIEYKQSDEEIEEGKRRKIYMEIVAEAWRFFREQYDKLPDDHIVKLHEIRMKRRISSDAKDNHYLFGWAPASRTALIGRLRSKGFKMDDMVAAGVAYQSQDGRSYYCPWGERLMFPICDTIGRPVGFSGRLVRYETGPDAPKMKGKYVNSRDNEIYHKSELLFCQSIARRQSSREHKVYVVEGQFDVIAMQVAGHDNTVASSGTAFTMQQARSLQRMVGDDGKIIFMFDADTAGQHAAIRTFKELGSMQSQAWACITEDKDPSDMLAEGGVEALNAQLGKTKELWRHVLEALKAQYDLGKPDQSREFLTAFADLWKTISDSIIADSAVRLASLWTGVSVASISSQLGSKRDAETPADKIIVPESNLSHGMIRVDDDHSIGMSPDIALNASALAEPDKRFVLEHVTMRGIDEEFRTWLLRESNGGVLPESPFDLKSGDAYVPVVARVNVASFAVDEERRLYVEALYKLNDEAHRFDLAASMMLNTAELMTQQLEAWVNVRTEEKCRSSFASLSGIGSDLDMQVLKEYEARVREIIDERNDLRHDLDDKLHDVFVRLAELRVEQQSRDADEREARIKAKVDEAVRRTRSALDLSEASNADAVTNSSDLPVTATVDDQVDVDVEPNRSSVNGDGLDDGSYVSEDLGSREGHASSGSNGSDGGVASGLGVVDGDSRSIVLDHAFDNEDSLTPDDGESMDSGDDAIDGLDDDGSSTVMTGVDDPWADSDLFVAGVDSPGVSGDPESYSSHRNLMAVDSGSEAVGDFVDPYQTVDRIMVDGTQSRDDGVADETTTHGGAFSDEDFGLDFSGPDDGEDVDSSSASGFGMPDPQVIEGDGSVLVADDFGLDFPDQEDDGVGGPSGDVGAVDSPGGRSYGVSYPQVNGIEAIPPDGGHGVDSSDDGGYDHSGVDVSMGVDSVYGDYDWFDGDEVDDDDRVYSNPGAYEEDLRSAPVGPSDDGSLVLDWDPRAFDNW